MNDLFYWGSLIRDELCTRTDGRTDIRKAIEGHTGLDVVSLFIVVAHLKSNGVSLEAPSTAACPDSEWTQATRVWIPINHKRGAIT